MKGLKKPLSVILTVIMLVSCVSVSFAPLQAYAAAPTNAQLKAAFQAITNTTDLTNGDGSLLNAAEVLYNWAYGNVQTGANNIGGSYDNPTLSAKNNNSIVNFNSNAKSAVGSTYNALIDSLLPTSGVYDDSGYRNTHKSGDYWVLGTPGFDTSKLSYNVTTSPSKSVTVAANLTKVLKTYASLDDVPASILLKATYKYNHTYKTGYVTKYSNQKQWGVNYARTWYWRTYSCHYFSSKSSITRTVNSTNTQAYKDLHAFNDYFFTNGLVDTALKTLCDDYTVAELQAFIDAVDSKPAAIDKAYGSGITNHFFDEDKLADFRANCVYAQKVINAKPAITALNSAMDTGYDNSNLAEMEEIYTAQKPNLDFLSDKQDIITYVATNYDGYSSFSLESAADFMNKLFDDIELYKIREIKNAIDRLREEYPDVDAVSKIDTDEQGNYINDNLTLWSTYDIMFGYVAALEGFETENVAAVFTEGTDYVYIFKSELKYEWDYRGAEKQYESYYAWFLPLVYKDLTAYTTEHIIGTGVTANVPNIPNATTKKSAYNSMYNQYEGLIGADTMKAIFGDGENALGFIIDDYIERLYAVILARLTSEVDTAIGYYDAFGKITLDNFVAVKEAVDRVERNIWDFINKNNSSIISSTLRTNYNRLSTLLNQYNSFVAGDGLAGFTQKHLHDSNGVFITREPVEADKARAEGENYDVTEKILLDTMKKLDAFLVSNDFTELVDIDQDPNRDILLSDFIKESMAQTFYTDEFVNMLVNIIYPALASTLESVFNGLPKTYDTGIWGIGEVGISYNPLTTIINKAGIGVYPNQVDDFIASGYGTAKTQMSKASTWKALCDKDGNLTLDWGINAIKPENYSSTSAYLTAKKNKFLGAMAEAFDAILPILRVLLADRDDMQLTSTKVGSAYKEIIGITFSLEGDLVLNADGCAGYSNVVVPILEAFGCSGIQSYATVKNYTTTRQFVNAIFNPIIDFFENKLAKAPAETIASILPNLAYAIPFDKLWDLVDLLNIRIYYTVDDSILGIKVIDKAPIDVKFNTFLTKNSLPLEFDISNFSDTLKFILSSMLPGIDFSTLPILNSGEFIRLSKINRNASTLRQSGKRINLEADKADVFMAFLKYLASCLGDEAFVEELLNKFMPSENGESSFTPEVKEIVSNIYTNPEMAIAATVELLNQQEYALEDYNWYDGSAGGTVSGLTPAAMVYLSHTNDWDKETADYFEENINDILGAILDVAGSELDIGKALMGVINSMFTNKTLTDLAKAISGVAALPEKALDIIYDELDIDLALFNQYASLEDTHNWGFEDGDRDGFIQALIDMLSPLEPLYGVILFGENLTLFKDVNNKDLVTFYGNNGYDNAFVPLLEALGCDLLTEEYDAASGEEGFKAIIKSIADKLDKIAADPINEILDTLPGVLYYLSSDGLTTSVRNLLHPIYVILDTIRPLYDVDLNAMIDFSTLEIDIEKLDVEFAVGMLEKLSGLNLEKVIPVIYDICKVIGADYTSESEFVGEGRKGVYTEGVFDRADMLTVCISAMIELLEVEGNCEAMDKLLGTENISAALLAFFKGVDPEMATPDWMYYFDENHDFTDYDFDTGIIIEPTVKSLSYDNNWTQQSAAYVNENLDSIINTVLSSIDGNYNDLASLVDDKLVVYSTENVQAIADLLKTALSNVDSRLFEAAGVVLDSDLKALESYTAKEGIDTADEFVDALIEMLNTVPGVVDWMLFGKDYRFFTGTSLDENGEYVYNDLVTVKGAQGYKKGIAPVLEAIGCQNLPSGEETDAVELMLNALFGRVEEILADPANELLEILPNLIYFINANGLVSSANNMLGALHALVKATEPLGIKIDINNLFGFDLSELTFAGLIGLIEDETGTDLTAVKEIFAGLCIGTISTYSSVSGEYAYKMTYTEESDRKDMITLILTAFVKVIGNEKNADIFRDALGEETFTLILDLINLKKTDMKEIDYLWTEYADTDKTFSAIETSVLYSGHKYGPLYTREMAQHIADNIQNFIDNIIYLLGIEVEGARVDSLEDILNSYINGSLYNSANAQSILDMVKNAVAEVEKIDNSGHLKQLIKTSLDVDLDAWDNYTVPEFDDDRAMFTQTVCEIFAPAYPVLEWALCNKDFALFTDEKGDDVVTILGAEGYAYGVIPLMEVLECEGMLAPDAYCTAAETDKNALVTGILDPLFDRLDEIMSAPADEILDLLPNVIYFINSGGLDTCFKNALNAVYTILDALEPLVEVDLYELINIRLDEITFESIFDYLLETVKEETGIEFAKTDIDSFLELTVGKLVSYQSANGKTAYKMVYQSETAKAEMVTIALRLLITFLMTEDNRESAIALLKDKFSMDADAEKYVRGVLDVIADCTVETHIGMDKALATVYYLFYGSNIAADETADAIKNVNAKWQQILKKLGKSENPDEASIGNLLAKILGHEIFEDIIDAEEGIAPNGFIRFFAKLKDLFQRLIDFFKNLFN